MKSNYFAFIVAIAVSVWNCLAATAPSATDFWVRDDAGRITHTCGGQEPLVICMQGRKVVMQVESNSTEGLGYTARFYNLQRDLLKTKNILFEGGRESNPEVQVDHQSLKNEFPSSATFDGLLTFAYPETLGVVATRTIYPSMNKALVIEEWQVRNTTDKQVTVTVAPARRMNLVDENIAIVWNCQGAEATAVKPGGLFSFSTYVQAKLVAEPDIAAQVATERGARRALAEAAWRGPGRLETPDPSLDVAFALQKFHVLECPIETYKGIITHNGSLTYSPGIWANDPVEYSSPVFPFFGDAELNRAGMNMYRVWQDYCQEKGIDPFPGSFEGPGLKLTQRERGDDAMVLYGLSKFLLFQGDRAAAEELWPLIEFSAESVLKHTTTDGIIASQTDEMEGRYPTGTANLSTSALAYGGYRQAAHLARALAKPVAAEFDTRADALRKAIESYFGAEIEGFETYRYYQENTTLRGWILLPLAMGITERENGTSDALLSDKLWPNRMEGADILAESTRPTEWGRETYYALRVLFKTGRTEEALDLTRRVVQAQVFGSKGPYPDEDAIDMLCPGSLYPRIFVEGVFGIVPTSFDSFECTPRLPEAWPRMALRDVRAFGRAWDLVVERAGDQQKITVSSGGQTVMTDVGPSGKTYSVTFAKPLKVFILAGQSNMEGHAAISTFDYIGKDPQTAPLLKEMRNPDGTPRVCDKVWMSYLTGPYDGSANGEGVGKLTAGFGARGDNPTQLSSKIGPEFTFGIYMEKELKEPILIIKTAWGGRSLNTEFRPPSAGQYKLPKEIQDEWDKHPQGAHGIPKAEDRKKWQDEKDAATGVFYRMMIEHVKKVLADPKRVCPEYDEKAGYELAGFVWLQGFNDLVDGTTYPGPNEPGKYDLYSDLLAKFIRDVRKDLSAPKMPFVIGVLGVGGESENEVFRKAMAAPAAMPEFKGNVIAVETAPFWDHVIEAAQPKQDEYNNIVGTSHTLNKDGSINKEWNWENYWKPVGKPLPEDRIWRFVTIDATEKKDKLEKYTDRRFRDITLPAGMENWYLPDFDDSKWTEGKAPIGKGVWNHSGITLQKFASTWGKGEFLLMRTTFDVEDLNYDSYRIAVLARQGFHVYLNGQKIHTYIWWQDRPQYGAIVLEEEQIKHLKKGKNVLAVYANDQYGLESPEHYAAIDVWIERITKADQKKLDLALEEVLSPQDREALKGASNGGYHYFGSAKIFAQMGKAFAEALLTSQK